MIEKDKAYFENSFFSIEKYADQFRGWNIDARKLDRGNFESHFSLISCSEIQLSHNRFNGIIEQFGTNSKGFCFAIPGSVNHRLNWFNKELDCTYITKFPATRELNALAKNTFNNFVLSINEEHFYHLIDAYQLLTIDKLIKPSEQVFKLPCYAINQLASYIQSLFIEIRSNPYLFKTSEFWYKIKYLLPYSLLDLLERSFDDSSAINRKRSDFALEKSLRTINANLKRQIQVAKLAEYAGVSEKTLEIAFKTRFGITPNSYIQRTKINQIRKRLIIPENKETISSLINQYGISHLGHFSANYHEIFKEYPSETKSNATKSD